MAVNFCSSIVSKPQVVLPNDVNSQYLDTEEFSLYERRKKDRTLKEELFNENLVKKYTDTGLFSGYNSYDGSINDKVVSLTESTSLLSGDHTYVGFIGDDKAALNIDRTFFNGTFINGFVGDKQVELNIKKKWFGNYSISGIIDGKEISIEKGSSVDSSKGENDILTTVGSLFGISFSVNDGKFGNLKLSKQSQIEQYQIRQRQRYQYHLYQQISQQRMLRRIHYQQMLQQQQMMQQ